MGKTKPKRDGRIPTAILNQLNEHTAGGFVLFYFNSEDASPEEVISFDSPIHCLALQKHIADWTYALQDLNVESAKSNFLINGREEEQPPEDANN